MPPVLNPGSLERPSEAKTRLTVEAVERFARVLDMNIIPVNRIGRPAPGIVCVSNRTGQCHEFATAEEAAQTLKRMAYMHLYGGDAEARMRVEEEVANRAVAAGLVDAWRDSYPELKTFAEEVFAIVKEMQQKEEPAKETKPVPRRIINLQDD